MPDTLFYEDSRQNGRNAYSLASASLLGKHVGPWLKYRPSLEHTPLARVGRLERFEEIQLKSFE